MSVLMLVNFVSSGDIGGMVRSLGDSVDSSSGIGDINGGEPDLRLEGFDNAYAGGGIDENDCPLRVGDDAVELASDEDISGDESGDEDVLNDSLGRDEGAWESSDSRRRTMFC